MYIDPPDETDVEPDGVGPEPVAAAFHVADDRSANWVVRKISEARGYRKHVEAWAAAEIRRSEREEDILIERFGNELRQWVGAQIGTVTRAKSLRLPAGRVGFRTEPTRLTIRDEARLLSWCRRQLPHAVKVVERVLVSVVREHFEATGELADGSEIGGGGERFFIK